MIQFGNVLHVVSNIIFWHRWLNFIKVQGFSVKTKLYCFWAALLKLIPILSIFSHSIIDSFLAQLFFVVFGGLTFFCDLTYYNWNKTFPYTSFFYNACIRVVPCSTKIRYLPGPMILALAPKGFVVIGIWTRNLHFLICIFGYSGLSNHLATPMGGVAGEGA